MINLGLLFNLLASIEGPISYFDDEHSLVGSPLQLLDTKENIQTNEEVVNAFFESSSKHSMLPLFWGTWEMNGAPGGNSLVIIN